MSSDDYNNSNEDNLQSRMDNENDCKWEVDEPDEMGEKTAEIRKGKVATLLGESGYDETTLLMLDKKLAASYLDKEYHFHGDYIHHYYGEEDEKEDVNKEDTTDDKNDSTTPVKPTMEEIKHYEKSIIIREDIFDDVITDQATEDFMNGNDEKNYTIYDNLYKDIYYYRYAWFGVLLKDERRMISFIIPRLKNFALLLMEIITPKKQDRNNKDDSYYLKHLQKLRNVIKVINDLKKFYQDTVEYHDREGYEEAELLEHEVYELHYHMATTLVLYSQLFKNESDDIKDEVGSYFLTAYDVEKDYSYEEQYCKEVLEFVKRRAFNKSYINSILMGETTFSDKKAFFYQCIYTKLYGEDGDVLWKRILSGQQQQQYSLPYYNYTERSCGYCLKKEYDMEINYGKKLLACARCRNVFYCCKDCQKKDWKNHKQHCQPST